jgi:hypothetical protein
VSAEEVNESMVVYQGWLQGVKQGDKIKVDGKIYFAKEVASGKTTYQFSGVTTVYYVKKVIEKIINPLVERMRCRISLIILQLGSRKEHDLHNPLTKYARNVERYRQFNKRALPRRVRVLRVDGLRARKKLVSSK